MSSYRLAAVILPFYHIIEGNIIFVQVAAVRSSSPPNDESSRDSHTSVSSMSVSSTDLQIDVDTDCVPAENDSGLGHTVQEHKLGVLQKKPKTSQEPTTRIPSQSHKFMKHGHTVDISGQ